MNHYLKKTLLISASVLMFLSVGASVNHVSARRYRPRSARHFSKRHYRRNRSSVRRAKVRKVYKRRTNRPKRTPKKRWRRIKRYRTGYFDHYGAWHKYVKKAKSTRRQARKVRRQTRKTKRSYYGGRPRKINQRSRRVSRRHESYAEKIGAARDENFNTVNADRESVGVDPIQRSSVLDQIAQERSKQLVTNDSHYDSNGNLVALDDLSNDGYDQDIWNGENIMSNSGYGLSGKRSGDQANKQWWTDEAGSTPDKDGGHRKNIRNPDFQSIGIGATYIPSKDAWYMCQDFSDETPDEIANGNDNGNDQPSNQAGQDDSGDDGGASAVAVAGGGAGGNAIAGSGSAQGGSATGGNATGGSAVGGAGGSASSVVGPTISGGNGNNNSNDGASSSSSNGEANVNADGISVTSGRNGTYINGKKVNPSGTYSAPGGASVTFNGNNVTVRGADGSESSSSL